MRSSAAAHPRFFTACSSASFSHRQMGFHLVRRGPAHHVEAQHLVRALGRFAAGPEGQHQARDDRAVGLNLDAVLVVAQQVAATQQMLELAEAATGG